MWLYIFLIVGNIFAQNPQEPEIYIRNMRLPFHVGNNTHVEIILQNDLDL